MRVVKIRECCFNMFTRNETAKAIGVSVNTFKSWVLEEKVPGSMFTQEFKSRIKSLRKKVCRQQYYSSQHIGLFINWLSVINYDKGLYVKKEHFSLLKKYWDILEERLRIDIGE